MPLMTGQTITILSRLVAMLAGLQTVLHSFMARQAQRSRRPIEALPHSTVVRSMTGGALSTGKRLVHGGLILSRQSVMTAGADVRHGTHQMEILIAGMTVMTGFTIAFVEWVMPLAGRTDLHVTMAVEAQLFPSIAQQVAALRTMRTVTGNTLSKPDRRVHIDFVKAHLLLGMA